MINRKSWVFTFWLSIIILISPTSARDYHPFDLWRAKDQFSVKGFTFNAAYTLDLYHVARNVDDKTGTEEYGAPESKKSNVALGDFDLILGIDAEKAFSLKGLDALFYILGNHGGSPSEIAEDAQTISNIDAPNTWKLYEAWVQYRFLNGQLAFLFGLFDLNSEFDVIETAGLFINSSHGIGPDFSQSGQNGPSIFPSTSLALRGSYSFNDHIYLQTAFFDGVPGDADNPEGTHINISSTEGFLLCAETGFQRPSSDSDPYMKFALGGWMYSARFPEILDGHESSSNIGGYVFGEAQIVREDHDQGIAVFSRIGFANPKYNQFGFYAGGGLVFTGLIPGRDADQCGLALARVENVTDFLQLTDGLFTKYELNLEATYRFQPAHWCAFQGDIQWIVNPGMQRFIKSCYAIGLRSEIIF